jgi:hypothetical protein
LSQSSIIRKNIIRKIVALVNSRTINMKIIYLIGLFIFSVAVFSQEIPELIGDRPDQTESAWTIPAKMVQIETGFNFESFTFQGVEYQNIGYNSTLIRVGTGERFEFRFQQNFSKNSINDPVNTYDTIFSGASGTSLGLKVVLNEEKGWIPRIAFLGSLTLPKFGNSELVTDYMASGFRFAFEHNLTENISLGYNLGGEWSGDILGATGIYSLVGGYSLGSRIGIFTELFGTLPEVGDAKHFFDAGLTFSILPNLQYDFAAGIGFSDSESYLFTTGIIWRISN